MKNTKTSSLFRLVAFLLITVVLIGAVGLVSEGMNKHPGEESTDNEKADSNTSDEGEEDGAPPTMETPEPTPPTPPEYLNYLSGLECTKENVDKIPTAYLLDSSMPIYGMSDSILSIEFPIEDGTSRILMYTDGAKSLGKIGSITQTRKFINTLCSYFGGILVHNGEDDAVEYSQGKQGGSAIDLSKSSSYAYSEGSSHLYTNASLMANALDNSRVPTRFSSYPSLPFYFRGYFDEQIKASESAKRITIPFGQENRVSLVYNEETERYMYQRNGINRVDLHNGEYIEYDNAFVLFCDSTTYERSDATELVLDTQGGGTGYYCTGGTLMKILWSEDASGNLRFTNTKGELLCINRGTSYISFYKTTLKAQITTN